MVIYCKHCGATLKVDDARMPSTTFRVKCHQCRNLLTVEPPKGTPTEPHLVTPIPVAQSAPRPPAAATVPPPAAPRAMAPSAARPAESTPTAVLAAVESEADPLPALAPARTHYLQKLRLFGALSDDECRIVESRLKPREFPPFQSIVKEGGPGDSMFFINTGAAEVRKRDPNTGIEFMLSELKAGSCFGELALLTGKPRTASVVATEPTTCSVLEQGDLEDLLLHYPKISLALNRVLAERLEEANAQTGIECINLSNLRFDARVMKLLPQPMMVQHKVLPVALSNNRLTLAMVNPNNLIALDDVRRIIKGVMIEPVVTSEDDFRRFMNTRYREILKKEEEKQAQAKEQAMALLKDVAGDKAAAEVEKLICKADRTENILEALQSEALKSLEVDESQEVKDTATDLYNSAEDAPIIRLANNILALAIQKGASDIHIEPQEKELAVRFRIDGALQQVHVLPKKIQMGLISRFKILSKLDIAEKRLPQDGRVSMRLDERSIDFRVSTIPSKFGEKVCMRILDKSNTLLGLDKLILHQDVLGLVRHASRLAALVGTRS